MNKRRNAIFKKPLALFLAFALMLGTLPDMAAYAEGGDSGLILDEDDMITVFDALPQDVALQSVTMGTPQDALVLPDTLDAEVDGVAVTVHTQTDAEADGAAVTVPVAAWQSSPEYDGGAEGLYIFTPELSGEYMVAQGVTPPVIAVTVTGVLSGASGVPVIPANEAMTLSLGAGEFSISGAIYDTTSSAFVSGVTVEIYDSGGKIATTTSAYGSYTFLNLAPGEYTVKVPAGTYGGQYYGQYYNEASRTVTITGANVTEKNISLVRGNAPGTFSISGTIKDYTSNVSNATVELYDSSGKISTTTSDSTVGSYTFTGLAPGEYTVKVPAGTYGGQYYNEASITVTISDANVTGANISLVRGNAPGTFSISGTIKDSTSNVSNATVELYDSSGKISTTTSDSSPLLSSYTFTGLAPGGYTVKVPAGTYGGQYYNEASRTVTISDANMTGANISLVKGNAPGTFSISGTIKDSTSKVSNATVELYDSSGKISTTTSDSMAGSYTFTGLAPGEYTVKVPAGTYGGQYYNEASITVTITGENLTMQYISLVSGIPTSVTTQPANKTVNEGETAAFSVTATADSGTLTYQWQVDKNDGSGFVNLGARDSNNTYTTAATVWSMNSWKYHVQIYNGGTFAITSDAAVLTVVSTAKTVSVGAQNGTLTAGTVGTVTFPVTTANIANDSYAATMANLPTGVSVSAQVTINNDAGTLTLAGNTNTIAGTTNTLTLTIDGTTSSAFTLTIAPATPSLTFTDSTAYDIPASTVGAAIANIDVSGGASGGTAPYTFSATDLPNGITISASGVISGTLTAASAAGTATITVTDSATGTASVTISYGAISPNNLSTSIVGFGGKQWYVIGDDTNGVNPAAGTITLLAKDSFTSGMFGANSAYAGSALQTAMTNVYNAFPTKEKNLIQVRTLDEVADGVTWASTSTLGGQHVWTLSVTEAGIVIGTDASAYHTDWWLRTSAGHQSQAFYVPDSGIGQGFKQVDWTYAYRPTLSFDISGALFKTAAESGKTGTGGALSAITQTDAVKYTVEITDTSALNLTSASADTNTAATGGSVSLTFGGAVTGADKYVSCVLENAGGMPVYYGRLSQLASGTVSLTVPAGLPNGSYTIKVFNEEYNGDNSTDFASTPVSIPLTVGGALTFTDSAAYDIPASTVGTAISNIDVSGGTSGGTTPYTFSATGLPAGITISTAGVISGTPTAARAAGTATVTVTDSAGSPATANITIAYGVISPAPVALTFIDDATYDIPVSTVGTAIANIDVSGGVSGGTTPYTFSATDLPNGITISAAGVISGTPTTARAAGTATVTVTDSAGSPATENITIAYGVISLAPVALTFTDSAAYDIPASTVGTAITNVDVSGGVSGGTMPYTFSATELPAGITISAAGVISGTPTAARAAGTATITVTDSAGSLATENITIAYGVISPAPVALTFTDDAAYDIPVSTVGTAIASIDVSGGVSGGTSPYTFSTTELPAGITISAAGVISGTPTTARAAGTATVTVTDSAGSPATENITIAYGVISPAPVALTFTDDATYDIPASTVGTAIVSIDVSGGASGGTSPYTFSATGLPAGITISAAGVISGTPTTARSAGTATITVTDSAGSPATENITIAYGVISPALVALTFTDSTAYDVPASTVGTAIANIDVSGGVSGGTSPYTFNATGLPAGITISTGGVISGTPTTAGAVGTATITVTDSAMPTAAQQSITINYGAISTATKLVTSITVKGAGGSTAITTNGGTLQMLANVQPATATIQSVTWSVANGTGSATISAGGLLTATGNGTVTVRAAANDGSGVSGSRVITISGQTPATTHTITFNLAGGTRTGGGALTQSVAHGNAATALAAVRSNYTFIGWDKAFTNVTADMTVTAQWSYNGGGGGGNGGGGSYTPTTPVVTEKQPNMPVLAKVSVTGTVEEKILTTIITVIPISE